MHYHNFDFYEVGGCLPPPKVTFWGGFGFRGSLDKNAPNSTDAKSLRL